MTSWTSGLCGFQRTARLRVQQVQRHWGSSKHGIKQERAGMVSQGMTAEKREKVSKATACRD